MRRQSQPNQRAQARNLLVLAGALAISLTVVAAPAVSADSSAFTSTPNIAIPDDAYNGALTSMAYDTINASGIPADQFVNDITVELALNHTWVGDLTVKLRSPAGTVLTILNRPGSNASDGGANSPVGYSPNLSASFPVAFNDDYNVSAENMGASNMTSENVCQHDLECQFSPAPDTAVSPSDFASAFVGEQVGGDWTLFVGDSSAADVGTVVGWNITIEHAPILAACTAAPFSDVPAIHAFCAEIKWMKDTGISTGFGDGTYRPAMVVTRQAMSAFMARLAGVIPSACTAAPFSDVAANHQFCAEIKWMKDTGISTGFGDGTYRPAMVVTRQAMSAFMARLAGVIPSACTAAPFSDVPANHQFCAEIKWMEDVGISTGFGDGTYRPSIAVTRQAMSAFIYRVSLQLDADILVDVGDTPSSSMGPAEITYTATVINNGPEDADSPNTVTLSGTLPAGTTFQGFGPGSESSCTLTGDLVECSTQTLDALEQATFQWVIYAGIGTHVQTVEAFSDRIGDPDTSNNSDSVTTTLQEPPG